MKFKVEIRPMSANQIWQGRRYKTTAYKKWRRDFGWLVREKTIYGWANISIKVYIKRYAQSDVDNFLKGILDALVENRIIENDRFIKKISIEKIKSDKEYIEIEIEKIT